MRVLIIINYPDVQFRHGIVHVILNYKNYLVSSGVQCVFAANIPNDDRLIRRLTENGEKFYQLPDKKRTPQRYIWKLFDICRSEQFDAVHVNGNSATMALELMVARHCGIPKRIAHCHNSRCEHPVLHSLLLPFLRFSQTDALACSHAAGDWIFGRENYTVLHNAIDLNRFQFSAESRKECREEMGISPQTPLIGHVGNFNEQKNHTFLLKVFAELQKSVPCELVLLGDGSLRGEIEQQTNLYGLADRVHFAGVRQDVEKWLCAMDLFLFPSRWEGLGMAVIEAQVCGLPVVASTEVPQEAKLTEKMEFLSLSDPIEIWVTKIQEMLKEYPDRSTRKEDFKNYDIALEKESLLKIYTAKGI